MLFALISCINQTRRWSRGSGCDPWSYPTPKIPVLPQFYKISLQNPKFHSFIPHHFGIRAEIFEKNCLSSLPRLPSASFKSMPPPPPQCLHCLHLIIVVASPSLPPSHVVQSQPSPRRRWDLHAAMPTKTISSSLFRSSPPFPFIFMFSKKLFVASILPY